MARVKSLNVMGQRTNSRCQMDVGCTPQGPRLPAFSIPSDSRQHHLLSSTSSPHIRMLMAGSTPSSAYMATPNFTWGLALLYTTDCNSWYQVIIWDYWHKLCQVVCLKFVFRVCFFDIWLYVGFLGELNLTNIYTNRVWQTDFNLNAYCMYIVKGFIVSWVKHPLIWCVWIWTWEL